MSVNSGIAERFSVMRRSTRVFGSIAYSSSANCWLRGPASPARRKGGSLRPYGRYVLPYANEAVVQQKARRRQPDGRVRRKRGFRVCWSRGLLGRRKQPIEQWSPASHKTKKPARHPRRPEVLDSGPIILEVAVPIGLASNVANVGWMTWGYERRGPPLFPTPAAYRNYA